MRISIGLLLAMLAFVAQAGPPEPAALTAQLQDYYFDAARRGDLDMLNTFIDAGYSLNTQDDKGYTALILAAYHGQGPFVERLLTAGADACVQDNRGNTALMGAIFKGELNIAQRLLGTDCNPDQRNGAGQTAAMYAGFCNAKGDMIAVMDADLQDPPSLLPQMVEILESGEYDSVATRRADRKGEPPLRSFFARQFYRIVNRISDADIVDCARDFRLMKREMAEAIVEMSEYNRFSKGIFGWVGFRTCWLPYENVERVAGETKWSFWGLFKYALDGIINFSQVPLSISSWAGILMTIFSFLMLVLIVVRRLVFGDPVAGWASTVCVIIFIGGIQMFCLGIIGQYIAKIYMESKHRPHFIISETNDPDAKKIH